MSPYESLIQEARERIAKRHARRLKSTDTIGALGITTDGVGLRTKDPRMVSITITTDDVDLQREVIMPEGVDWAYVERNKNVFADHNTDIMSGVGVVRTIGPIMASVKGIRKMRGWTINACIHKTELGDHCLKMAEANVLAASIGFLPGEGGAPTTEEVKTFTTRDIPEYVHRAIDALEATLTLFPCNAACRVRLSDGEEKSIGSFDAVEGMLSAGVVSRKSAAMFGFPTKTGPSIRVLSWKKTPPIAVSK